MRLYAKLAAIVLIAVAVQWTLKRAPGQVRELWFAARCSLAHATRNAAWQDQLVCEAHAQLVYGNDEVFVSASGPSN